MKEFVGEFVTDGQYQKFMGNIIGNAVLQEDVDSEEFQAFLCIIFKEGNFAFLRKIAEHMYNDSRKTVVINFIDAVEELTNKGHNKLWG